MAQVKETKDMAQVGEEKKSLQAIINDKAEVSKENASKGKPEAKISLTDKFEIEFVKDFGYFQKGAVIEVSELARDYYIANEVAKEVK